MPRRSGRRRIRAPYRRRGRAHLRRPDRRGAMLDATEQIGHARVHLSTEGRRQIAGVLGCEPERLDSELDWGGRHSSGPRGFLLLRRRPPRRRRAPRRRRRRRKAQAQARARHAAATRSNLGLGHDIRAGLIQPTDAQLNALRPDRLPTARPSLRRSDRLRRRLDRPRAPAARRGYQPARAAPLRFDHRSRVRARGRRPRPAAWCGSLCGRCSRPRSSR